MNIIVKQTRIEIQDYLFGSNPDFEKDYKIYDNINHCYYYKAIEYDSQKHILKIPRGVNILKVERAFNKDSYIDTISDPYNHVSPTLFSSMPRDEDQIKAIQFMTGEGKYAYNKEKSQLFLNLPTGKGKTYCTIYSIAVLRLRAMIIASNSGWLKQWQDMILQYTNIKPNEIYMMTGEASIHRLLEKRDLKEIKYVLATHSTIRSYGEKYGWEKVSKLFIDLKIGVKAYDEAHLDFDNICKIDFNTNTLKTFYVTATAARSNKKIDMIYKKYFEGVSSINLFNEDTDPHTKYIAILYNSQPSQREVIRICNNNQYGFDRNLYTNYVVKKRNFYLVLISILKIALQFEGKCLIYIGVNDAIFHVYNWIIANMPWLANDVGIYTSVIPEDQKAAQLEKKIILSTTKSCGAASDIKGLKMTVVLAEPFRSEVLARQTLGRTRDPNTYYFEVVDLGFASTQRYYKAKKKVFEKYALTCAQTVLSDDILSQRAVDFLHLYKMPVPKEILKRPMVIRSDYK